MTKSKSMKKCLECHSKDIKIEEIDYSLDCRVENQLHRVCISGLSLPICQSCGAKFFSVEQDEQINEALRKHMLEGNHRGCKQ